MCASGSCAAGYHWHNLQCVANVCTCANGTPKSGAMCSAHGAEMCATCAAEHHLAAGTCKANKQCSNEQHQIAAPTGSRDRECTNNAICGAGQYEHYPPTPTSDRQCATHSECLASQYEVAAPTATSDRECATKQCHCPNGSHVSGAACPVHDIAKCASCDAGYHLAGAGGNERCDANVCVCMHGTAA